MPLKTVPVSASNNFMSVKHLQSPTQMVDQKFFPTPAGISSFAGSGKIADTDSAALEPKAASNMGLTDFGKMDKC